MVETNQFCKPKKGGWGGLEDNAHAELVVPTFTKSVKVGQPRNDVAIQ